MKKQLEVELKELANSVLDNNSETDINVLKEQAASIYERLCVLAYARNSSSAIISQGSENTVITKEIETPILPTQEDILVEDELKAFEKETSTETVIEPKETTAITDNLETETIVPEQSSPDLLFELEELTADFKNMPEFERATPITTEKEIINLNETATTSNPSLNDRLKKGITIGLNDRLAFVKHLFDNNQQDYSRVISQLNTLENSNEAASFIEQMVKPEYSNWEGKEAFEERFINAVFSKFDT